MEVDDDDDEIGLENLAEEEEMTLGNFYTDLEGKQPCLTKYSHDEEVAMPLKERLDDEELHEKMK